jgi:hypothetical protein
MSCPASASPIELAASFVLAGSLVWLFFVLVPTLALREASVLFFLLSRLRVLLIHPPHKAKSLDFLLQLLSLSQPRDFQNWDLVGDQHG